jgi:hypothetical protein
MLSSLPRHDASPQFNLTNFVIYNKHINDGNKYLLIEVYISCKPYDGCTLRYSFNYKLLHGGTYFKEFGVTMTALSDNCIFPYTITVYFNHHPVLIFNQSHLERIVLLDFIHHLVSQKN